MAKLIKEKQCKRCSSIMHDVDISKRYCADCRKIVDKENGKRYRNHNSRKVRNEYEYLSNFKRVVTENYQLTTKGFNQVSEIKSASYLNYYKKPWIEILNDFGYSDKFYEYLSNEFMTFNEKTSSTDIKKFFSTHEYLSTRMLSTLDVNKIRKMSKIDSTKKIYSLDDITENFNELKTKINDIPIYNEFIEHSKISMNVYFRLLNVNGYDNIIEYFCNNDEIAHYYNRRSNHKSEIGQLTGQLSKKYSDKYLLNELKRVFDMCLDKFGDYPSRRLFSQLSEFDSRTYTQRFNLSWTKVCEMCGYKIKYTNRAEQMCLDLISKITNSKYEPQKTFEWLLGVNSYPLFCDGYFPELNLVVEFDGRQHREPVADFGGEERFMVTIANDNIKNTEIPKHDLKLLRISSEEPWYDEEYIKNKLNYNEIFQSA